MREFFKKSGRIILILLVIAVAIAGWLYTRRGQADAATSFQTVTVERGNLVATIGATGTVRAKQTAVLVWQAATGGWHRDEAPSGAERGGEDEGEGGGEEGVAHH